MITWLIFGICIAALCQPSETRMQSAAVFAGAVGLHELCFAQLDGFAYYASAGAFDTIVVLLLANLAHSALTTPLQVLSLVSLLTNGAGWLLWYSYTSPIYYNTAFIGIYVAAILIMVRGSDAWGRCKNYVGLPRFSGLDPAHSSYNTKVQGEEGN